MLLYGLQQWNTWPGTHCLRMRVISWNFRKLYHALCSLRYTTRSNLPSWILAAKFFSRNEERGCERSRASPDFAGHPLVLLFKMRHFWKSDYVIASEQPHVSDYFTENATENVAHAQTVNSRPNFSQPGYEATMYCTVKCCSMAYNSYAWCYTRMSCYYSTLSARWTPGVICIGHYNQSVVILGNVGKGLAHA